MVAKRTAFYTRGLGDDHYKSELRLPRALLAPLRELARRNGRSLNAEIVVAIRAHVTRESEEIAS